MTPDKALALIEAKIDEIMESTLVHLEDQLRTSGVKDFELEAALDRERKKLAAWRGQELTQARAWLEVCLRDD